MLSAAKRFNRPSTTAISKENRGRLSCLHDPATYARTEDSFALVSQKRCLFPRCIPKLHFPSFYVTPCIDATCLDPDMHSHLRSIRALARSRSNPSNPIRISRACTCQKWPISTDRFYSRAKSTLSHTPALSLNCFGKALTAESAG